MNAPSPWQPFRRLGWCDRRKKPLLTKPALAAANREGDDDPVTDLEIFDLGSQLDHLTHIFVAQDIAAFHRGLITVKQMKIGTANRTGR